MSANEKILPIISRFLKSNDDVFNTPEQRLIFNIQKGVKGKPKRLKRKKCGNHFVYYEHKSK